MAMDSNVLAQQLVGTLQAELASAFPEVVKSVSVSEVPLADGTVSYDVVENRGPIELIPEKVLPLATAIAKAVVEHIKAHAEVDDQDATYGGTWRVS